MARYTDAKCRLCRREGEKLFLKGEKCFTDKCAIERRSYAPGQHGQKNLRKSDYGIAAAREAESAPHLRRARAPVPRRLPGGGPTPRDHWREPAPGAGEPARHRVLPHGFRCLALRGAPDRASQRHRRQRQACEHSVVPGASG